MIGVYPEVQLQKVPKQNKFFFEKTIIQVSVLVQVHILI